MKLAVVSGGGIAPVVSRVDVSTDSLSPADARMLREKVHAARVPELAKVSSPGAQHPEDVLYEVTVEDEGGVHTARLSESSLPESVRSLITWAESHPAAKRSIEPAGA